MIEHLESRKLFSTYFINSAGNDLNDGLTESTPWASLAKVASTGIQPGDTLLLNGGDSFAGSLKLNGLGDNASIAIDSYGSGRATLVAGNNYGILAQNTGGVRISDLNIVGLRKSGNSALDSDPKTLGSSQSPGTFSGISFDNSLGGNSKLGHIYISNVDVSGFGNYGVTIGGSAGKSGFNDVQIDYVSSHDNTVGGIETHGVFTSTGNLYANTNVFVRHSKAYNNPGYAGSSNHVGDGIVLSDVDGVTIERSEAYNNGALNSHVGGPVGIWVWDVNRAVIQNNESHHNHTGSSADGGGFDFDGGVTNSVMQYNYSHDNDGPGYGVYQFAGARPFHDITVRYNISANDSRKNSYGAIDFWNGNGTSGISKVDVYNNTVYITPSTTTTTVTTTRGGKTTTTTQTVKLGDPRALRFISGTTDVSIRNNIFYATGDVPLTQIDARQTNLQIQGNDWYSTGTFAMKASAKTYTSFSAFAAGTEYEKLNGVVVGKSVNPLLTSVTSIPNVYNSDNLETALTGFKLLSTSPLRGAGLNLRLLFGTDIGIRDFYGDAFPADGIDIGAHEYV